MQSGSDRVLAMMKRRYNTRQALAAMERIRKVMPRVQFTTDLMVGFPGETEEMFWETLDFVKKARFLSMHVFTYSRRRGTPADTYPNQIDEGEKTRRSRILSDLGRCIRDEILTSMVEAETPMRLLLETACGDMWMGHTDEFIEAHAICIPEKYGQGDLLDVIPVEYTNGILLVKKK
jgi:threonylcarbamoyladenosine tRNA methylthiotransferase MtaB